MARRFLDEEQKKVRKRNNAVSSISRNITATAKQAKTQQRPVERRTMNISKATASAPKTQAKAQKSTQITQPKKQRNYNQNTWSPVVDDPVKEYFSPVPDRPKVVDPAQQRRQQIMRDAIDKVEPTAHISYEDDITLKNLGASLDKGLVGGIRNVAINAPANTLRASEQSWQNYNAPDEAHNFVELSPEMREYLANRAGQTAQALTDSALNQSLNIRQEQLANPLDGTFVGGVMESTGNMIPSMAASYLTGGLGYIDAAKAANMATMLTGAYGGAAQQAYEQGVDPQRAMAYGLTSAAIEGLTENMNHYVPGTFGQIPGIEDLIGEGEEEAVGRLFEPFTNLLLQDDQSLNGLKNGLTDIWNENFTPWNGEESPLFNTLAEAGKEGLAGMASAALMGGAQGAMNIGSGGGMTFEEGYAQYIDRLQAEAKVLESAGTPEATQEAANYRQMVEDAWDEMIRPDTLLSANESVRAAAQKANTDRIMAHAQRYGVDSNLAQNMAKISNKVGVAVTFDENMDGSLNGKFENGKIVISTKAADPVATVFSHELTHALERSGLYNDYRAALYELADSGILNSTHGTVAELQNLIRKPQNYGNVDQATVDNETTAILTQDLLGNAYAIDNLINKNRGLAVRLYEGIKDTLNKFGATAEERMAIDNKRSLQKAEDLFRRAMENPGPVYDPATNTLQFSVKMTKDMLKDYAPNALDKDGNVRPVKDQLRDLYNRENRFGYAAIPVGDKLHFMGIDTEYLLMSYDGLSHALRHTSLPELQEIFTNFGDRVLLGNDFDGKKTAWISFPSVRYGKNMPFAIGLSQDTPNSVRVTLDPGLDYDALDVAMDAYDKHSFSKTIERILNDPNTKKYYGPHWQDLILEFFDPAEAAKSMPQLRSESHRYERRYDKPRDPVRGSQFSVKLTDDDGNYGYHYGSPEIDYNRKSETLFQRPGRGTGAFGTGMYFFGEGRNNSNERSFKDGRTEHKVDFSDYNLYKPKTSNEANALHRYFKLLDDTYQTDPWQTSGDYERGVGTALNKARQYAETIEPTTATRQVAKSEPRTNYFFNPEEIAATADLLDMSEEEALAFLQDMDTGIGEGDFEIDEKHSYMDDDMVQDVLSSLREVEDDTTIEKILRDATDEDGHVDADYLVEGIERYTENSDRFNNAEEISRIYEDAGNIADMLGVDRATFNQAVEDAVRTAKEDAQDPKMPWKNYDSLGTRVMKALGYEGIDVRGLQGFDNSAYGSVIYDLKPETVQYSRKLTKPAPGQMQLDLDGSIERAEKNAELQENLRSPEMMDAVSRMFYNDTSAMPTQEVADIYNKDQISKAYNETLRRSEEIDSPKNITEIWDKYQKQQATEQDVRDSISSSLDEEATNLDDDIREKIIDDAEEQMKALNEEDLAPNQSMENVASGKKRSSRTSRQAAEEGLKNESYDTHHRVHHKETYNRSAQTKRAEAGSWRAFADQLLRDNWLDEEAPVGTIKGYKNRAEQAWKNFKGPNEHEIYARMTDLKYAIDEGDTTITKIEAQAARKGIILEQYPVGDGTTTTKAYDREGVELDSDAAKAYINQVEDIRKTVEALRKQRVGLGSIGGTILNFMKDDYDALSPAGQLEVLQKALDSINADLSAKFRKKFETGEYNPIEITAEFKKQYIEAKDRAARDKLVRKFLKEKAREYKHTFGEQVDSFRYLMMLTNPVTWIRNKVGNHLSQGMYSMKNGVAYMIERGLQKTGRVGDYSIDMTNEDDQALVRDSRSRIEKKIAKDIADNKNLKSEAARRKKFGELGYTGKALDFMASYKGETFNRKYNAERLDKVSQQMASNLKNAGADLSKMSREDVMKEINRAYNENSKQLINQSELRHATAEGKMAGRGDTTMAKELWAQEFSEMAKKNSKTSNIKSKGGLQGIFYDEYNSKAFNGDNIISKGLNAANNLTGYMMNEADIPVIGKFGDQPFTRDRWARSFMTRIESQGYKLVKSENGFFAIEENGEMLPYAESRAIIEKFGLEAAQEASESVFRDANKWADLINEAREINLPGKLLLDAVMPFTRTPLNIGRRAIEYSPVGLTKSFIELRNVKNGTMSANQWIDDLAKGITGSGLTAIGFMLAELGMLSGDRSGEDDKEKKFRNSIGMNDYSFIIPDELGGGTYTLDWAAPSVSGVLAGAQLYDILKHDLPRREDEDVSDYMIRVASSMPGNTWSLIQPILDTTYMQGLLDSMSSIGDADRNTIDTMLESYAGQFTPTVGARLRKTWDETARSTYSDNVFDRILRQARNKSTLIDLGVMMYQEMTGGEGKTLEPQLDNKGNEIKNVGGNFAGRLAYNMLSPGTYRPDTEDSVDTELLRLYNEAGVTNNSDILPAQLYQFKLDDKYYKFKPGERTDLNKYYLQGMHSATQEYMNSSLYRQQTDQERVNTLNDIRSYYTAKTKENYFSKVVPDAAKDLVKGNNLTTDILNKNLGVSVYQGTALKGIEGVKGHDGETISGSQAMNARDYLESIGVSMDDAKKLVNSGQLKWSDLGLTEKVAGWDSEEYRENMRDLEAGLYGGEKVYTYLTEGGKITNEQIDYFLGIESDKDINSNTVKNSRAMKVRQAMEDAGIYEDVMQMVREGKLSLDDVHLNKTVTGMTSSRYSGGSGGSSGRRRSSGGGSSRKSSDLEKLYQKLYDMAMNNTLDSIGDIASSMNKSAKTTVKDLVEGSDDTNHAALVRELEKMIAAQK